LAAVGLERPQCAGRRVGVILSGGNIDIDRYHTILAEA
jgi:threonine dehydratase